MANFKTSIHTERGNSVSRYANKNTHIHAATWDHGFKTVCEKIEDNLLKISIFRTGGSKNPKIQKLIHEEYINEDQEIVEISSDSDIERETQVTS